MHNKQLRELELKKIDALFMAIKWKTIQAMSGLAPQYSPESKHMCHAHSHTTSGDMLTIMQKKKKKNIIYKYTSPGSITEK